MTYLLTNVKTWWGLKYIPTEKGWRAVNNELKPCPLCGSPVHITEGTVRHYVDRTDYDAKIECGCGLTFEKEWTVEHKQNGQSIVLFNKDIVTAWNTRFNTRG